MANMEKEFVDGAIDMALSTIMCIYNDRTHCCPKYNGLGKIPEYCPQNECSGFLCYINSAQDIVYQKTDSGSLIGGHILIDYIAVGTSVYRKISYKKAKIYIDVSQKEIRGELDDLVGSRPLPDDVIAMLLDDLKNKYKLDIEKN